MKFIWIVLEQGTQESGLDPTSPRVAGINSGVVDTFQEALGALSAWQGAGDDPPHQLYQIIPIL